MCADMYRHDTTRNTGGKKKADGGKGKKAKGGKKGAPAAVVAPTASSVITKLGASIGETLHTPVRKSPFWSQFCPKTIILPRQARDKHRKRLRQKAFCIGAVPEVCDAGPRRGEKNKTNTLSGISSGFRLDYFVCPEPVLANRQRGALAFFYLAVLLIIKGAGCSFAQVLATEDIEIDEEKCVLTLAAAA
eukprot:COSAG06_NODE_855_length_11931_cov_20.218813_6_plen_190_part_00